MHATVVGRMGIQVLVLGAHYIKINVKASLMGDDAVMHLWHSARSTQLGALASI